MGVLAVALARKGEIEFMPYVYFAAAGLGVFVATVIAGFVRTSKTRREMRAQLTIEDQPSSEYKPAPAAMVVS
jgi:hypothetical protein